MKGLKLPGSREDGTIERGQPVALLMESDVGLFIHLLSLLSLGVPVSEPYLVSLVFLVILQVWNLQLSAGTFAFCASECRCHFSFVT